jgi:hypothetical protein
MIVVPYLIATAAGGLLLWALWMPWATATMTYKGTTTGMTANAWDIFSWTSYVLAGAGAVALLGGLLLCTSATKKHSSREDILRWVRRAGGLSCGLMLWRTFTSVTFGRSSASAHNILGSGIDISVTRGPGMYIALVAALAIFTGFTWRVTPPTSDPFPVPLQATIAAYATPTHPAAWYPDPHTPGRERWWDGQRWTWDTRDAVPA